MEPATQLIIRGCMLLLLKNLLSWFLGILQPPTSLRMDAAVEVVREVDEIV